MFYFEEILMRKYEFKRICKTLSYAKRIASRTRNAAQKAALRKEIAALEAERVALQRLLFRLAERYAVRHEDKKNHENTSRFLAKYCFYGQSLV